MTPFTRRISIFALLGVLLLAFAVWWYSPTQVLKRRCDSFFNVISFSEKQESAARHVQALKLADYLDRDVAISGQELSEEIDSPVSRGEMQAIFSAAGDACTFIAITERRFEFIGIDGDDATVQVTINLAIGHPEGARRFNGTHRMMLSWHRAKPVWVLSKVAWEKIAP
jgi:hypothetical protein